MLNTININLKTDINTDRPTSLPITLMSQDVNNNQFIMRFTSDGEAVALDDTYTVEVLTKFARSGASRLTTAKVRQDYATWEFDTAYITQDEAVYNYVYVRKSGSLVVSADSNAFYFAVGLSEIDKDAGRVAETYDENYEKYLDEFKENVDFEEIAQSETERIQAEQARKEAETLREESYEQKVDTAIVEADVVEKVDDKVTELTPQISNLTAQLAQTVTHTELDAQLATLLDGGPSIFMDSLAQLQAAYPNGAAGVALVRETDPAKIYAWDGSVWKDFGDYQGIEVKDRAITTAKLAPDVIEKMEKIAEETNILKKYKMIDGERTISVGTIMSDENRFRSELIPVVEGERFANVSGNQGLSPTFVFYKGDTLTTGNFVSQISGKEVIVPADATYMLFWHSISVKNTLIIKKMTSGFPLIGEETFVYKDVYTKNNVYSKVETNNILENQSTEIRADINKIGIQTDLMKLVKIVSGSRTDASGNIYADSGYFRTEPIPVESGERYATVAVGTASFPNFSFYSSSEIKAINLVLRVNSRDATVPANATFMIVNAPNALRDSFVIREMEEGFPKLGENTIDFPHIYTKNEVDKMTNDIKGVNWLPSVWELDIIDDERPHRVVHIDKDDVLYLSDSFSGIYKANNVDLSDIRIVATLPSNSVLTKFILVSNEKGVGYVQNPPSPEHTGFYVFENTHTDSWTYRKTGKMLMGHPPLEFQGLVKTPDSQYLFAISYSSAAQKITDPSDTTTEAPRHVYRSTDLGETWQVVYTHLTRFNTHMHAVEWDIYRDRLWVAIGDEGAGGRPGWAWSDDYGETFDFVENNDATGQIPFMDTSIIPTRKYVLFGSDHHPAGIRKWEPKTDEKHAHVSNDDVTTIFPIPYQTSNNFGFARNPVVDVSSYPYKVGMSFTHNADYSGSVVLLSPNFQDWFEFDYVADPRITPSWNAFSGMTSDGWVLGWSSLTSDGKKYYRRFKFPEWLDN